MIIFTLATRNANKPFLKIAQDDVDTSRREFPQLSALCFRLNVRRLRGENRIVRFSLCLSFLLGAGLKMLNYLKNILYDLIVWSGIVIYLIPVLKPFITLTMSKQSNHVIKDASGATIYVSKVKGRLYIPNTEHRILSVPNIRIRTTDVLLCGYPKTGCHWMHEMIHMLLNQKAALTKHGKELGGMIDIIPDIILDSLPSPRVLNSHLLYEELPKGVREKKIKIVYTVRNPKDTLVSYYNHHLKLKEMYRYSGNINDYYQLFMEGNLDFGSYFDHVLAWDAAVRNLKDNPVLLVTFEEISSDPLEIVRRVAAFLGMAVTEKLATDIADACSFNKMKVTREKSGHFDARLFRKGAVGDWRNWLTDGQSKAVDQVWEARMRNCLYQPTY